MEPGREGTRRRDDPGAKDDMDISHDKVEFRAGAEPWEASRTSGSEALVARHSFRRVVVAAVPVAAAFDGDTVGRAFPWVYSALMPRVRIGVFAAAVIATSLAVVAPAHADTGSDFLAMVSGEGINAGDTPVDTGLTLSTGELVCDLLHYGYTPQVAGREVLYSFPNATPQQATGFVDAAQATLCVDWAPRQSGW